MDSNFLKDVRTMKEYGFLQCLCDRNCLKYSSSKAIDHPEKDLVVSLCLLSLVPKNVIITAVACDYVCIDFKKVSYFMVLIQNIFYVKNLSKFI